MSQTVELSNGQKLEFPDGMSEEQMHNAIQKNYPQEKFQDSSEDDGESKGWGGVASDAMSKTLQAAFSIPRTLMHLPGEVIGMANQILTDPKRYTQNSIGGLGQYGHALLSSLGEMRDYAERKGISHGSMSWRLPESILPREFNYQEALGRQGHQRGDELISSVPSMIGGAPAEAKILSAPFKTPKTLKDFIVGFKPRHAAKIIHNAADASLENAVTPLNYAAKEAIKRDIPPTKLSKSMLDRARRAFPKTDAYELLLKKAKEGDHQAIVDLQSAVGSQERSILSNKNSDVAQRNYSEELGQLKKDINKTQAEHYSKHGHKDLADSLRTGRRLYAEHKGLYYGDPVISKLVGSERKVPKTLVSGKLTEISTFMNKFREAHPELAHGLKKEALRKKIIRGMLITVPSAFTIAEGVRLLRD